MTDAWRPTASIDNLHRRAEIIRHIRRFFTERDVLEVETPLLSRATVTDLHLHTLATRGDVPGVGPIDLHLQTSPEYAMKRLLAAGSGPIFQMCRAFRGAEGGRRHNLEFTMLEWYRPGWNHHQLMDEVDELLGEILGTPAAHRVTYGELIHDAVGADAHRDDAATLRQAALVAGLDDIAEPDRQAWLDLTMVELVEPRLGRGRPTFVTDYPASQAALARIRPGDPAVAERFEVFVEGVELANGYHELTDADEQRRRFEADLDARRAAGLAQPEPDRRLLAALEHGLPDCAGIALGVDRLAMLALGTDDIRDVIAFPIDRA
jgi:lysyl-tRNA synthetase class 2